MNLIWIIYWGCLFKVVFYIYHCLEVNEDRTDDMFDGTLINLVGIHKYIENKTSWIKIEIHFIIHYYEYFSSNWILIIQSDIFWSIECIIRDTKYFWVIIISLWIIPFSSWINLAILVIIIISNFSFPIYKKKCNLMKPYMYDHA